MTKMTKEIEQSIKKDPKNFKNYFDLGNAYAKEKQYKLALKFFKKTIELNKKFTAGYNNIGNIYKIQKNLKQSIIFYQKSIKVDPTYINGHYNLGVIYGEIEQFEKSLESFKKVLELDSNHLGALNNLGILLKNFEQYDQAIKCLEKAILLKDNYSEAINNLGNVLMEIGNDDRAIDCYKKAINIEPNKIIAYLNLLDAYENINNTEGLESLINQIKAKFPNLEQTKLYEGILLFRKKEFAKAKDLLKNISFKREIKHEILRNSFLAKSFDRLDKTKDSFKHFSNVNKLTSHSFIGKKYNKKNYIRLIDKRLKFFKKNALQNFSLDYPVPTFNPVFLIGFPRSGTTLLDTILRSHPEIQVTEEKNMVAKMLSKIKELNSLKKISKKEIEILQYEYIAELQDHTDLNKSKVIIDKLPLNIVHVGEIVRIFPNAKFILALRHPMDCVLSCFIQDFKLNDAMSNFLTLKDTATLYKKVMSLWKIYHSNLKLNYITIKYEDVVKDFKTSTKLILDFLNLDWNDSLLNYIETAKKRGRIQTPSYNQVIQPIYSHAEGRWKRYKNQLSNIQPLLNKFITNY